MTEPRIYLDNAATSWPKPPGVYQAVDDYQRNNGAAAGRGVHRSAQAAERIVSQCRKRIADLLGAQSPEQIVFTLNGTDSLNLALHGVLKTGDHVVTSVCEHNSGLRPLRHLADTQGITFDTVGCDREGFINPAEVRSAIRPHTRLIALTHASNVTGAIQPLAEVGEIAAEKHVLFLVDAAQSLGHFGVSAGKLGCHLLAAPGHKGLLGPLGTGFLYLAPGMQDELSAVRQGGTGTRSDDDHQPESLPDKYESGNLNVPGIAGLSAGLAWLTEAGIDKIAGHERDLTQQLLSQLSELPPVTIYGPRSVERRVGVVSFNVAGFDPQEVAAGLDAVAGIEVRSGLHCAPRMHQALGTSPAGTVRASIGPFTTGDDIDSLVAALRELSS
ncbi:putative cysteine desulfurase [Anatilimnocola aggregata]|uniref:cysteine desulfurase n=1 Tax=Anatilimnocola aggregata TaxID=2528021 RepID=A0A517YJY7_9BACT|nr:aminotransferase class V-fold PLP-dependent enzyme [Anatilimnocola aggregata]QDU30522.1 putative cysteine desulfurase [Anatilimnocola aggregata]